MTDLRKAAEMALEFIDANADGKDERDIAEALRQALAQPEQEPDDKRIAALRTLDYCHGLKAGWNFCATDDEEGFESAMASTSEAVRILKKQPALTQPEQEPVAWMTHTNDLQPLFHKTRASALNWQTQPTPLYTAPPISDYHEGWEEGFKAAKKEWVGLTGLEQKELMAMNSRYAVFETEAKLKEKNGG